MTKEEAAAILNNSQYGSEGDKALFADMKASGLVAVFGASDDLMELRGAVNDEVGCFDGGSAHVTPAGLFESCDCECVHSVLAQKSAIEIKAIWDHEDFSWVYETTIPHATFVVNEDDEPCCRGIVFALADIA